VLWLIAGGEGVVLSLSMMPSLFDATTPATPAAASSGKQPLVRFTSPRHLSSSSPVVLGNGLFGIGLRWSWNTVVAESSERRGVGCLTLCPNPHSGGAAGCARSVAAAEGRPGVLMHHIMASEPPKSPASHLNTVLIRVEWAARCTCECASLRAPSRPSA
jgi:hypothetical protein